MPCTYCKEQVTTVMSPREEESYKLLSEFLIKFHVDKDVNSLWVRFGQIYNSLMEAREDTIVGGGRRYWWFDCACRRGHLEKATGGLRELMEEQNSGRGLPKTGKDYDKWLISKYGYFHACDWCEKPCSDCKKKGLKGIRL